MYSDNNSDVSVSPLKICFLLVDPKHDYNLQKTPSQSDDSKHLSQDNRS